MATWRSHQHRFMCWYFYFPDVYSVDIDKKKVHYSVSIHPTICHIHSQQFLYVNRQLLMSQLFSPEIIIIKSLIFYLPHNSSHDSLEFYQIKNYLFMHFFWTSCIMGAHKPHILFQFLPPPSLSFIKWFAISRKKQLAFKLIDQFELKLLYEDDEATHKSGY